VSSIRRIAIDTQHTSGVYSGGVRKVTKRLFWPLVVVGLLLAALDLVEARYIVAPLIGMAIWRIGYATFGQFGVGASYIPDGDPVPVDTRQERVVYWCGGCGAEVLLLVRGTDMSPRHCGEKMVERREVARELN